jgi:hypothetical protein
MVIKFSVLISTIAFAGLAYCGTTQDASPAGKNANVSAADAECERSGGTMQKTGRAGALSCLIAYKDAGKACKNGSECAGDCRLGPDPADRIKNPNEQVAGICQANNSPFGCYATVENGVIDRPMMCVD